MSALFYAGAALFGFVVYELYKKEKDETVISAPVSLTPGVPVGVPNAYACQNQPGLFVLPGYMWNGFTGIVVSNYKIDQYDSEATPLHFGNGIYWFRQGIDAAFQQKCPSPQ